MPSPAKENAVEYIQENRLISIKIDGQDANTLLLQSFTCTESLSRPFVIQAELLCLLPNIDFTAIIGQKALITVVTLDEGQPRYFHGYVSRFAQSGSDPVFHHYHMEIVPWLWFLTRNADCRIFHNKSIPEILQQVFGDLSGQITAAFQSNLQNTYAKLEYTVQYRETSFNFVSRLMEHAGIYYYFDHTDSDHTLQLCDNSAAATASPIQSQVAFLVRPTGDFDEDQVSSLYAVREFKTGKYSSTDYNFITPSTSLEADEPTVVTIGGNGPFEIFDYPGIHKTPDEGRATSKIRMKEHEAAHHLFNGTGRVRGMIPGYTFTLTDHYRADLNIEYLVTEVRHSATVGGSYRIEDTDDDSYTNQFTCIPKSVPYVPPRLTPKPLAYGLQTATVVGKSADEDSADDESTGGDGEEIWVDKYGRVLVHFPWDRAAATSCWMRVSQDWAGQGWGMINIPRVGQEVLVSYLDGDPDRPIITGRVYNALQTVPYTLPDYGTRTTFKTRSTTGGGADNYNELRFEDKTGKEQVFVRGEKDYDTRIKNDSREWIKNNRSLMVGNDQLEKVTNNLSSQVGNNEYHKIAKELHTQIGEKQYEDIGQELHIKVGTDAKEDIGQNLHQNVGMNWNQKAGMNLSIQAGENMQEKSGMNWAHEAGMAIHLKAGMTVVIEAGMQLSLKAGGSFIDIGPAGIAISGAPLVMINSGGAAGSGAGSSPESPQSPTKPQDPTDPDEADDGSKGTKMNG